MGVQNLHNFPALSLRRRDLVNELKECSTLRDIDRGRKLHEHATRNCDHFDAYVANSLVNMYARCGKMERAKEVFDNIEKQDVVSWTVLIMGYAKNGESLMALDLFSKMVRVGYVPDARAFIAVLTACTSNDQTVSITIGKILHLLAAQAGCDLYIYLQGTLLDMYAKCGSMENARQVFDTIKNPNVVCWNALILGYVNNGQCAVALKLFSRMERQCCVPDKRTFVSVIKACTNLAATKVECLDDMKRGEKIHLLAVELGCDLDIYVQSSLIDLYGKCGCMENAQKIFDGIKHANVVCWTSLIMGYVDNGEAELALATVSRMWFEGCDPNSFTFSAILKACGLLGALGLGRSFHTEIIRCGLEHNVVNANALVDFYAKCGSMNEAQGVFDFHPERNLVTWTSLMAGYSCFGAPTEVFSLFDRMRNANLQPDGVTFNCILVACCHSGLVDKGKEYFEDVPKKYGLKPSIEHYTCMIDMFGRSNQLENAMMFLRSMHLSPNAVTWTTVLGACRKWKNPQLGCLAFESLMKIDTMGNAGAFVVMANIYGSRGMWVNQARLNAMRKKLKVRKSPGKSWWSDSSGLLHTFRVGDKEHPRIKEIQNKLETIFVEMKQNGFMSNLSSVSRNISDSEKEDALCEHSEKLAIACALIHSKPGETVRIVKNLRTCEDCHAVTLFISKLERRTIICRDANRFHVVKDGKCSCDNFW